MSVGKVSPSSYGCQNIFCFTQQRWTPPSSWCYVAPCWFGVWGMAAWSDRLQVVSLTCKYLLSLNGWHVTAVFPLHPVNRDTGIFQLISFMTFGEQRYLMTFNFHLHWHDIFDILIVKATWHFKGLFVCLCRPVLQQDMKGPWAGVNTDGGETTAASWMWYSLMDEAIGVHVVSIAACPQQQQHNDIRPRKGDRRLQRICRREREREERHEQELRQMVAEARAGGRREGGSERRS